jgi:hypothetical protein
MAEHPQVRHSQTISTYGPGALIDFPDDAAIMGGLDDWPKEKIEVQEMRLRAKLQAMTGIPLPRLYRPPVDESLPWEAGPTIPAYRFPQWFIVQEPERLEEGEGARSSRRRRLVHEKQLDDRNRRYEKQKVIPIRFVAACPKGHVTDVDWMRYVHRDADCKVRQLSIEETGTGGDLSDLAIRCKCGQSRPMHEAMKLEEKPLGQCNGSRPWLGSYYSDEHCGIPLRLLIRNATNAYFSQVVRVLSIPEVRKGVEEVVQKHWGTLTGVDSLSTLQAFRKIPDLGAALEPYSDEELMEAIEAVRGGSVEERPLKQIEVEAILAAEDGFGEEVPGDPDFYARRLPEEIWRKSQISDPIEAVIQLHRLREVAALTGFTRFEPLVPDIQGEYDSDVEAAPLALDPQWFPAVENRGEGIFIQLRTSAVQEWLARPAVQTRLEQLENGQSQWNQDRKKDKDRPFVGGPYVLLHTLSHMILQSLSLTCGYPASAIRERIYVTPDQFGFLLYTGSPDADGTLGGLVQQARSIEQHLRNALKETGLCSSDPICAQHEPGRSLEQRWLHGAACHGCCFIAETSCEMRNDYLDRALVAPVIGEMDAALFEGPH